jgi:hypothetical protein
MASRTKLKRVSLLRIDLNHNFSGSRCEKHVSNSVIRRRDDLKFLVGMEVLVSGRVKEYRRHEKRRDLDTVLLTSLIINPLPIGESIFVKTASKLGAR